MIGKTIEVLVINDDFDTVELFSEFLMIKGISVVGKGYNGKEAVELYQKLKPDIVFLDIMMPRYDGFYALDGSRKIDPRAKLIMITADLTSNTADRLEKLQVPFIYKPYEIDDILAVIKKSTDS